MMRVSVVIPAWNAATTLGASIKSALDHAAVFEVIVVDDGSTDATAEIARAFGPPVRVESIPNGGVSRARNHGFALSSGQWIQFLDSDDQLMVGAIAGRLALGFDADVIVSDWVEFTDDGELRDLKSLRRLSADWTTMGAVGGEVACATSFWAPPAAILYRRSTVERIGGFREDLPVIQDARHLYDAAFGGARFARVLDVGAAYRVGAGSLSRRDPASFWRDTRRNGQQIRDGWLARGSIDETRRRSLADIFSGSAYGLFQAGDPHWRDAMKESLAVGGVKSTRMQFYSALDNLVGQSVALKLLALVRHLRRAGRVKLGLGATASGTSPSTAESTSNSR